MVFYFVDDVMISSPLFQNIVMISRRPSLANFADTIKIAIIFSKTIFKYSIKVQKKSYVLNCNFYFHFLMGLNLLIYDEKMLMSAVLKVYVT